MTLLVQELHAAAAALHGLPDHVEPHAASRHRVHRRGRAEARLEQEALELGVGHRRCVVARDHALLDQRRADLLSVDAAAVIADGDVEARRPAGDGQHDRAFLGLARGRALGGRLDPVRDGVAQEVHHGIAKRLEQVAVDLGVGAFDAQRGALVLAP